MNPPHLSRIHPPHSIERLMGFHAKSLFNKHAIALALGLFAGGATVYAYLQPGAGASAATGAQAGADGPRGERPGRRGPGGAGPVHAIRATAARVGDLDITLSALGTVTASNTATVKPRVSGQLVGIHFREGQLVKAGELLAEIDPRPFRIQLDQTRAQRVRDEATLGAARVDLERYRALLAQDSIARQQVDAQEALVRQLEGTVAADAAQEAQAALQLEFTRVTAPAGGRLGLRVVDVGNQVDAQSAAGLVVITQTQPIHAVFALPADALAPQLGQLQHGGKAVVEAWSRDGRTRLAEGRLISIDNQIDVATGSLKLKAEFANQDNSLFPNQFINVRLRADTRRDSVLLQSAAVQRNAQGSYVFVVGDDQRVQAKQIRTGPGANDLVVVEEGLAGGERIALDGTDQLRDGARVDVLSVDGVALALAAPAPAPDAAPAEGGERRPRRAAQ
ncbi:multidrug transporter subunit MdtA [Azoarcus sp. DD4]|uniref:MdtA/MuxA family multidrug efflux RND transporter periplasmic adaptor subunit n=1 Tax=Azoarcus sp. DD4 TaxID=2027405 RepID=UPI00112B5797|nr:MdtA/MuxA family multidrug efflux RND transporter periplasmic adaptor subunit [Azoarcus sp. DD4]QDF97073.1 multidrug transporter subunit MdtA [Azoarcus sp. DD4]